ncbi:MAG: surface-adhesin E family protein [Methylocystis sp.]
MWKIGVSALMSTLASSASARVDWAQVSSDGFSTVYMDLASRRTSPDGIVTIDALTDYDATSPQAAAFGLAEKGLSEIETASFDCVNRKYRSEGGAWRQGQMGEGKIVKSYPAKDGWSPVPPYYDGLFAKVCASKSLK